MYTALARPIWKEQTCEACGCVYRGRIPQPKTDEAVEKAARSGRSLAGLLSGVNSAAATLPCPGCGTKPHYVVALWRFGLHIAVVGFSVVAGIVLGVAAGKRWLSDTNFYAAVGGVAVAACVLHLLAWRWNPNSALRPSKRRAESAAEDGLLAVVHGPSHPVRRVRYPQWPLLAVPCALISAAAPASAVLLLGVEKPPTIAQTVQIREVVKAGDRDVAVSWDGGFKSVSGLYRTKKATVTLKNAKALGVSPDVRYELHQDNWSAASRRVEDTGDSPPRIQVTLAIPDDPKVKGETLEYRVELAVEYPSRVSSEHFLDANATYTHDFKIRVATDAEVAAVRNFNTAGLTVLGANFAGLCFGLFAGLGAVGAWNPRDTGTPVAD